jgi:hypothetical protein
MQSALWDLSIYSQLWVNQLSIQTKDLQECTPRKHIHLSWPKYESLGSTALQQHRGGVQGDKGMEGQFSSSPLIFQNIPSFSNIIILLLSIHDTLMNLKVMKFSLCAFNYDSSNNQEENEVSV